MSFDAFGKRRDVADFTALAHTTGDATYWNNVVNNYNRRTSIGYTGHQQVDLGSPDQGLIHMGGRMYDPHMGRFLSADPVVQATSDLQSYNRYAYVRNNPLALTDPSGYSWWGEHVTPHGEQIVRTVVAAVISYVTAGAASEMAWYWATATVAAGGYAAGYVATGSGQGGLRGALTAVAFYGVGSVVHSEFGSGNLADIGTKAFSPGDFIAATTMHGIAGGIIEDLYGGNFGHGFLGAFINKAAAGPIDVATGQNVALGAAVSAVVGGAVSEATGGKFANGALTAAMAYLFNQTMDDIHHGNSLQSTRQNHVYEITDEQGNLWKCGVSCQRINKDGSSPRANSQLKKESVKAGKPLTAKVVEKGLSRPAALSSEAARVTEYHGQNGRMPPGMQRPLPAPTMTEFPTVREAMRTVPAANIPVGGGGGGMKLPERPFDPDDIVY
jgi:RHS repeat-associated protein